MSDFSSQQDPIHTLALQQQKRMPAGERVNLDGEKLQHGLAKLVLTLVEVITEILERQALRRTTDGSLTNQQIERMGLAFMQIRKKTEEIVEHFGFTREELNVNLGPIGKLRNDSNATGHSPYVSLVDLVDKLIDQGTVVAGEVTISVADVDLVVLNLLATLSSVQKLKEGPKKEDSLQ